HAYKTAKIVRTVPIETYNLTDRYFGGNIYRCAILKNNPYVLLVDKYYTTLGLLLPFENMHMLTVKELLVLCERYKIKTTPDLKKDDIIEL
ncbi:MAG TPA: hypothetical protein DCO78_13455, partial [Chitinophagaceae bacterium]|nr:hypothetical protein [Chitinophagaceae bacterium]